MKANACGTVFAFVLCLSGCASNEPRSSASANDFSDAQSSIERANQSGAQRYASRELNMAREHLDRAREAAEQ